jgi:predicted CoA-substrate-specific enzyme activase
MQSRGIPMITAGVDIGAETTKAAIFVNKKLAGWSIVKTGLDRKVSVDKALKSAEQPSGVSVRHIQCLIATGSGRKTITIADNNISDVIATGRGASVLFPTVHTVIDIGAEQARAIRIGTGGAVQNFVKNDKCAAGVGAFLGAMATALEFKIEDMGPASLKSQECILINSTCVVFTESEVVSLIHSQKSKEDIAMGIHESIAIRTTSMVQRLGIEQDITLVGGVAMNVGVVASLKKHLDAPILVPEYPKIVTAMGAAIIAQGDLDK